MKNLILDSVRYFSNGNLAKSATALNQHFIESEGCGIIHHDQLDFPYFADSMDWHLFVDRMLIAAWTEAISIGKIYKTIWSSFPNRLFPNFVAHFNCWHFKDGLDYSDEEAYSIFGLDKMLDTIIEGIRGGIIQFCPTDHECGFLPSIGEEYFEVLSSSQRNKYFAKRLQEESLRAIELRATPTDDVSNTYYLNFLAKYTFVVLFFSEAPIRYLPKRLESMLLKYPLLTSIISQALQNHTDSIPDNDDLADFIFLYTGGQVLPDDPRAWMQLFAKSVKTGKMLIPSL